MPRLGATGAHYCMAGRSADAVLRFFGSRSFGPNREARLRWDSCDGLALMLMDADPDHIAPLNALAEPPLDAYQLALMRWAFGEVGHAATLFLNVSAGDQHRGFVSFVRTEPHPWPVDPAVLTLAAREISRALRLAWTEERRLQPPAGECEVDAGGALRGDPLVVEWAERQAFPAWRAAAGRLPDRIPTPIGLSGLRSVTGAFLRESPHSNGCTYSFDPIEPLHLPPMLTALSTKARRVASLAAAGATTAEIAREIGRSTETVREHLEQVYRVLGVSSRSELAVVAGRLLV